MTAVKQDLTYLKLNGSFKNQRLAASTDSAVEIGNSVDEAGRTKLSQTLNVRKGGIIDIAKPGVRGMAASAARHLKQSHTLETSKQEQLEVMISTTPGKGTRINPTTRASLVKKTKDVGC